MIVDRLCRELPPLAFCLEPLHIADGNRVEPKHAKERHYATGENTPFRVALPYSIVDVDVLDEPPLDKRGQCRYLRTCFKSQVVQVPVCGEFTAEVDLVRVGVGLGGAWAAHSKALALVPDVDEPALTDLAD